MGKGRNFKLGPAANEFHRSLEHSACADQREHRLRSKRMGQRTESVRPTHPRRLSPPSPSPRLHCQAGHQPRTMQSRQGVATAGPAPTPRTSAWRAHIGEKAAVAPGGRDQRADRNRQPLVGTDAHVCLWLNGWAARCCGADGHLAHGRQAARAARFAADQREDRLVRCRICIKFSLTLGRMSCRSFPSSTEI